MAKKKYMVDLTAEERTTLEELLQKGKSSARKLTRARILLQADEGLTDEEIATALEVGIATVERTRQRFVERNLEALNDLPRPGGQCKLSGKQEAHLIAVACTPAPTGRPGGPCNCWRSKWWSWGLRNRLRARRCARCSKKHAQTLAAQAVVSPGGERGVCRGHGRCAGFICRAL